MPGEWILVGERIPPLGVWVLVANRTRHVQRVAWRLLDTGWWECDLEEYDCVPPGEVAHWMPLPEPPHV